MAFRLQESMQAAAVSGKYFLEKGLSLLLRSFKDSKLPRKVHFDKAFL